MEPECLIQRLVVHKGREKSKDVEHVELLSSPLGAFCILCNTTMKIGTYLSNPEQLRSVAEAPVTKFVAQDRNNLLRLTLLNQRVVDDDVLLPRQPVEVRIAVRAPLAAIDDVKLMQREVEPARKVLDAGLEVAGLQRGELVEQRQDGDRVDGDGEDLDEDAEEPQVVEERVARLLDDLEHGADDGCAQHDAQHLALQDVRHPQLHRLLVEAELLLKHKGVVVRHGQRQNRRDQVEDEEEEQRVCDLALEARGEVPRQPDARHAPELRQHVAVDEDEVLDLAVEAGDETELGFCASVCLLIVSI